jgi:hypothetical protein
MNTCAALITHHTLLLPSMQHAWICIYIYIICKPAACPYPQMFRKISEDPHLQRRHGLLAKLGLVAVRHKFALQGILVITGPGQSGPRPFLFRPLLGLLCFLMHPPCSLPFSQVVSCAAGCCGGSGLSSRLFATRAAAVCSSGTDASFVGRRLRSRASWFCA